ncbi:tail protein [Chania multitudinisentens RB-25]|uniref:Tail protein n=1 Tax=Chania multitudinisentens RB-25 TaxID=1441930 RepID=W0L7X0_9GAMM|nr:phage tail protein I [Chania multitudinisentens]AHG18474.1 tail protein [Chania multitudinisentens RB-25]
MNSLLPISASPLERNVAQACSGIDDIPVPLRDLWNPDTCPVRLLPYLAWARSVDRWDESWPEETKRAVVRGAFFVHQRKGTVAAVRRVIENAGYTMLLSEWWQLGDPAGTFQLTIDVNEVGITAEGINDLEHSIEGTKPASRHIAQLTMSTNVTGNIWIGSAFFDGEMITIYPKDYEPNGSIYYDGLTHFDGNHHFSGE